MITLEDLLMGVDFNSLPEDHQNNLKILLTRIQKLEKLYGKPLTSTSGYRTKEHHINVYKQIAKAAGKPFDLKKVPMGSCHLTGKADDISDPKFNLTKFCKANNSQVLKDCELWAEDDQTVKRLHVQISPPKSGKRLFKP